MRTESILYCSYCLTQLTDEEVSYLLDEDCSLACLCLNTLNINTLLIGKSEEEKNIDFSALISKEWYHATTRENWLEEVRANKDGKGLYVHLGNERSAFERAGSRSFLENVSDFIVYKVKFKPNSLYIPVLEPDNNDSFDELDPTESDKAALFYKNRWENPGSISVVANPYSIEIIDSYPITLKELKKKKLLTLMNLTDFLDRMLDSGGRIVRD